MYYHAVIRFGTGLETWTNLEREELLREIFIPYVNKQVILVNRGFGKVIMNLSTANFLSVLRTNDVIAGQLEEIWKQWSPDDFAERDCTEELVEQTKRSKLALQSRSLLEYLFLPTNSQVFVVMRFGDKVSDSAYEEVIEPTIVKFNYKPIRIDRIEDSGRVTDQVLGEIAKSEIVLADLTGERPNCYYEAGFAHAIGKEIIFTIKKDCPIHFDLAGYRFIEWETEGELRQKLTKRLKAIREREKVDLAHEAP